MMILEPGNIFYRHIEPEDVPGIVGETVVKKKPVARLHYTDPVTGAKIAREEDIPFYKLQDRTILGQNKLLDPRSIEEYIAQG